MTSRERVKISLDHMEPDRIPLDVGGIGLTSIHVSTIYNFRQALGLDKPGTPVKILDPFAMTGEIKPDLYEMFGFDVIEVQPPKTFFGYKRKNWKEWELPCGTPVLVPEMFNTDPDKNGDFLQYPEGDKSVPPSGRMPKDGYYFDAIIRQEPFDADNPVIEDNLEEFQPFTEDVLEYYGTEICKVYEKTDKAIVLGFGGSDFGDIALVPAPWMKRTKGIRDIEEWYISLAMRQDFIYELFDRQCDIAIDNLKRLYKYIGNKINVITLTGTDFGMQTGTFISPKTYRKLFKPFQEKVTGWVHENTEWKTFIHSCGSVVTLMDDFIEAGFDIFNPVQCSAAGMDPVKLKKRFGSRISFWGGGVDTQKTLCFGTPEDVKKEVRERIGIFKKDGGFVFAAVHNIQANTPPENLTAMLDTVHKHWKY